MKMQASLLYEPGRPLGADLDLEGPKEDLDLALSGAKRNEVMPSA